MNKRDFDRFEMKLQVIIDRLQRDISTSLEQTRGASPNTGVSEVSNAPTHLGDLGTDEFLRNVNSVLVENETQLLNEALAALRRIHDGTFGTCESCGTNIPRERLDVLPHARYCTACAEKNQGSMPNLNAGRLESPSETLAAAADVPDPAENLVMKPAGKRAKTYSDTHAAGTPGGGTAVGGLAGSPAGNGAPTDDLEDAMGSSDFDARTIPERDARKPKSGQAGGAVGGTPAGKRSRVSFPRRTRRK